MSETDNRSPSQNGSSGSVTDSLRDAASKNPITERLLHSAEGYLGAKSEQLLGSLSGKVTDTTKKLADVAAGEATPGSLLGRASKGVAEGESPGKAVLTGAMGEAADKVKSFFGGGKGPKGRKSINIVEDIDVGVPVRVAYDRWTQLGDFSKWAKGVQSVSQDGPTKSSWNAKVFLSKRNWNAKITEQVPDERISWTSDGPKGTVDGVISFHELAPKLTRVMMVLEYHPAGLFEKTGNLWRAQGRRARLDLKLYRRFAMMSDEEVEGWRGEIRDGEVVREHDEAVEDEQREQDDADEGAEEYADDEGYDDEAYDEGGDEDGDEGEEGYDDGGDDEQDDEQEDDSQPQRSRSQSGRRRRAS